MKNITFTKYEDLDGNQRLEIKVSSIVKSQSYLFSIEYDFNNKQKLLEDIQAAIKKEVIPEIESSGHPGSMLYGKLFFNQQVTGKTEIAFDRVAPKKIEVIGFKKMKLKLQLSEEEIRFIFQCFKPFVFAEE